MPALTAWLSAPHGQAEPILEKKQDLLRLVRPVVLICTCRLRRFAPHLRTPGDASGVRRQRKMR